IGEVSRIGPTPATASASASPSLAQQMPAAPASSCRRAIAAHLWLFACGRTAIPAAAARAAILSMFASSRSTSTSRAGVGRRVREPGSPTRESSSASAGCSQPRGSAFSRERGPERGVGRERAGIGEILWSCGGLNPNPSPGNLTMLVGASAERIAFVTTAASGFALLEKNLEPDAGANVVLLGEQFPSNVYPWRKWRGLGVELRMVG